MSSQTRSHNPDSLADDVGGGVKNILAKRPVQNSQSAAVAPPRTENQTLKATHTGTLRLGDRELPCAVLEDGTRLLSERGVARALGSSRGGSHWRRRRRGSTLPVYVSASNLEPYIPPSLQEALSQPIKYSGPKGGIANGVKAMLLPEVCEVWLDARDNDALLESQKPMAEMADIIVRGLARVGIVALIDEVTGYQEQRDRNELHRILEKYISVELLPWTKRFPDEFYAQMFRLRDWSYSPVSVKRPILVGKLTNKLVYEHLPEGVLEELRNKNPVARGGRRRFRHHQYLTRDIGNEHLNRQILEVVTLMKVSDNWKGFERLMEKAFPPKARQIALPGLDDTQDSQQGDETERD